MHAAGSNVDGLPRPAETCGMPSETYFVLRAAETPSRRASSGRLTLVDAAGRLRAIVIPRPYAMPRACLYGEPPSPRSRGTDTGTSDSRTAVGHRTPD